MKFLEEQILKRKEYLLQYIPGKHKRKQTAISSTLDCCFLGTTSCPRSENQEIVDPERVMPLNFCVIYTT